MLRAVAEGRAEMSLSCAPDLFIDGLACSDQFTAHELARAGLVLPTRPGLVGQRVPTRLSTTGEDVLAATPVAA